MIPLGLTIDEMTLHKGILKNMNFAGDTVTKWTPYQQIPS